MIKLYAVVFVGGYILGRILDCSNLSNLTVTTILLMWALGCATICALAAKKGVI